MLFVDLLSTVTNAVSFCVVFPALTLHVYVPVSVAASGLNVSVLMLPMVVTSLDETGPFIGSNQVMLIVD